MHIQIRIETKYRLKLTVFIFSIKFGQKRLFPAENRKGEQHLSVLHIQISLGTKFQLKLTILIFWTSPLNYAYST